ncbi:MFS transporter [Streptomyces sp. H51]|uniref:MFS transporter n=1 Tax=Streptomyces sp. H51 TaxID=3111770 RepID=UPI002D76AAC2|nr:MFS transporter [Streptomyces sp. H51]
MTGPASAGEKAQPTGPDDEFEPSPFRSRRFVIFALGNTVNNIGEAVYATALPLLMYELTGSLAVMTVLAGAVPVALLLAPSLGVAADRWGPRVLVVPGLLLQAAAALAMNLLLREGVHDTALLFVCALLLATGGTAYRTGWMTGIPGMFPACKVRARGTLNSLFFASTLIGPLIVTATLPWLDYSGLLWFNLLTFFAPIVVWALGIHPPASRSAAGPGTGSTSWKLTEGWRAIRDDRRILAMLAAQISLGIACGAGLNTLIIYELGHTWRLSAREAATALTVMNVCMLAGNLLVAQRKRFRPRLSLVLGMTVRAVSLLLFAVPSWPLFLVALALGAVGQGAVLSTAVMMRVKFLPATVLGRASGLLWLLTGGAALLSPVVTPLLSGVLGARPAFLVLAAVAGAGLWYVHATRGAWTTVVPPVEPAEKEVTDEPAA